MAEVAQYLSPVFWDPTEYELNYVVDNVILPQRVQVVEGVMFSDESFLDISSETVLTLHGLKTITKLIGHDQGGREVYISLNCRIQVRVISSHHETACVSFHKVKDLCNNGMIPRYIRSNRKLTQSKVVTHPGEILEVYMVTFSKSGSQIPVLETCKNKTCKNKQKISLAVDTTGDFTSCLPPDHEGKLFYVTDLLNFRYFPISVEFLSENCENPRYGPHVGKVSLERIKAVEVVFATTELASVCNVLTFPRNAPLTVNLPRGVLRADNMYSEVDRTLGNDINIQIIEDMLHANPYTGFQLSYAVYEKIHFLNLNSSQKYRSTEAVSARENRNTAATSARDMEAPPVILPRSSQMLPSKPSRQTKLTSTTGGQSIVKETPEIPPIVLPRRPVPVKPPRCPLRSEAMKITADNMSKEAIESRDILAYLVDDEDDDNDYEFMDGENLRKVKADRNATMDAAHRVKKPQGVGNECKNVYEDYTKSADVQTKACVRAQFNVIGYILMTDSVDAEPSNSATVSQMRLESAVADSSDSDDDD